MKKYKFFTSFYNAQSNGNLVCKKIYVYNTFWECNMLQVIIKNGIGNEISLFFPPSKVEELS